MEEEPRLRLTIADRHCFKPFRKRLTGRRFASRIGVSTQYSIPLDAQSQGFPLFAQASAAQERGVT